MAEYNLDQIDDGGHEQIVAKKGQLENMLRDYVHESWNAEKQIKKTRKLKKRNKKRDSWIEKIKMTQYRIELKNKQLSWMKKRDA